MSIASLFGRARRIVLAVGVASLLGLGDGPAFADYNNPDTDWMRDGKYGIYLKYLNWTPRDTSSAEYNRWVDAFDVDKFAETVELTGASWVIWGLGRVWFNSPNATLDGFVGDFTSNRDLPLEISNALQARGIRFMLYAAADKTESENDALGKLALGWGLNDRFTSTYVNNWADVLQVWSDRYATRVSGWWIDHAYERYAVSVTARGASNPELAIYRDHLLSGNSDGIVAFNHGWQDLDAHTPQEDYRSGHERAIAESVASSRWWHGLQWHYLSRLGPGLWGSEGIRYGTQQLIDYVNENNRHEGANTFSVFVYSKPGESAEGIVKSPGNLSNAQIRQLSALRDASLQFVDDTSDDVSFAGTWERQDDELDFRGSMTGSDDADAHAELTFSGIGVEVVVRKGRNGGLVDVELDGDVVLDDFDTYSRTTAFKQIIYTNKNLDAGSHTVRLVATGRKSAAATAADAMLDNFAVTMADTMRPRVLSITSDASHPTKDSFTVTIDFLEDVTGLRAGEIAVSNGSVSNFAGSGASYTLDIAPIAGLEGEVTVGVPANAVVDGANNGNLQGSETFTVDTRAPVIQTAVANQAVLTLVYGEALDPLSVPPASAFTLTGGGAPRTISNIVVNGSRVVLSMDPPASYGEAGLQVGYSAPSRGALADALGNKVPSFTNQAVANESPGTTPSADTWIAGATAFSVQEGDTAVATLTATETATAAGDPVWWIPSGAAGGPDGGKFALSRAGVLTFAAAKDFEAPDDANADGSYQVTVRLSVGALTAAADLTVTLTNRNEAPVANARANQLIVAQGATVTLSGSGSDPDADDTLTYAWTQTGTPAVALSDTAAASPTFTAPSSLTEDTTLSFTLRVADSSGLYHEDTVSVTVQKAALLTAAFENAPARHDGSTPFTVDLRFSEEVALWFSAFTSGLLTTTGGTAQRASRLVLRSNIGWRIPVTPDGDGDVVITLPANRACSWLTGACARDGRRLAVAASVTVPGPAPDPAAPDITSAAAFTVQEGETAVGTLAATDADTAAADLVWTIPSGTAGGADAGKFTLGRAGVLTFAAAKDFEDPDDANTDGRYQVTVQVSDGGRTDTANLTVSLTNVNEAPTARAGADQPNVEQGAAVTLSGEGSDPDAGDALTYAWTQTGGGTVTLSDAAVASATFTAPDNLTADAALTFALRVTDTAGLYHEDSVTVTVEGPEAAEPPEITGSTSFTVAEGSTAVATLSATDADTGAADLTWSIPSGTAGGADRDKFTLTSAGVLALAAAKDFENPDDADTDGNYQVTVQVTDGGRTDTANLTVSLTNVNEAPTARAGADQPNVEQGATVTLGGEGSDPDAGDALTYAWTQTGGGTVTLSDAAVASATFTAPDNLTADAALTFALRVTDTAGLYHEDSVTVTVPAGAVLTAAFENAPASHDGSTAFTVRLRFSENVDLSYTAFSSGLLTVSGGTNGRASRLVPRSNIGWRFPVTPDGDGDVVITLPANRACAVQPTVCTVDGRRLSVPASVTVEGPEAAEPPEITGSTSFTVAEGSTAVATLSATDADTAAADLTWSIPSGTAGGADRDKFTLTSAGVLALAAAKDFENPDDADTDGNYQVTVQVTDGGRTDTANLTVSLTNVNEAPTARAGADQPNVEQGATVTLGGEGSDPDAGDALTYAWTQTGGGTVTLSDAAVASATFTAPDNLTADAALTFALRVTDTAGLYHEDSVTVTVPAGAVLTAAFENAPASHDGSTAFTVRLRFSENVDLSYTAFSSGLLTVSGGTNGRASRLVPRSNIGWRFPVTPDGDGDVVITLPANRACAVQPTVCTVDGRRLSVPASVTVEGPEAAEPPEITGSTSFTVAEGSTAVATLSATDADTGAADLTWSIPSGTAGGADRDKFTLTSAGVLALAAAKDFENPDDADTDGNYQVTVQVTDGGRTDTANLTVSLTNVNEAPTARAGADQPNVEQGAAVTLSGEGSDPDAGDALTYAWTQTGGGTVTLSDAAVASATFTAPDNLTADAALTFALRVTDTAGLYHEDSVTVTVEGPPPATPETTVASGTGSVPEGATASFTVSLDAAATEALSVAITASETGVTLSGAMPGSVAFAVGDRIKTVTLATADDAVIESASTVTLTLASGAGYTLGSPASADVTVTDNDTATFRVSAAQNALDEGATTTVTVAITNGKTFAEAQSIAFSVSGSASAIDYELSSRSLTLAAGAVSASAMLTAVDDEAEESAETVAVTAAHDGLDIGSATVTIRASDAPLQEPDAEWGERLPDRDIVLPDGSEPTGLWSDGETLWVISDWRNGQVLTYSLAEGTALGEGEALLPDGVTPASSSFRLTGGRFPAGLWSDDETLWASDYFGGVRAYRLSDGTRLETQDISDDVLVAAGNTAPTGLWSDGETLWVTDYWQWKVFAYRLSDKVRVEEKEFDLMDDSTPYAGYGLWSDRETVLLASPFYDRVVAHSLATGAQQADRTVDLSADGIDSPNGLWSDGESMWVVIERDNRIYAYAVPGLRKPSDSDASGTSDPFDVRVTSRADDVPGSAARVFMPDATLRQAVAAAPGRSVTVPLAVTHLGGASPADYSGIPSTVTFGANQTEMAFTVNAANDSGADGGEPTFVVNFDTDPHSSIQVREGNWGRRVSVFLGNDAQGSVRGAKPPRPVTIPLVVTRTGGATTADYAAIPASVTFEVGRGTAGFDVRVISDGQTETGEGLRIDFGALPPGVTKGSWGYKTIAFVDADAAAVSVSGPLLTLSYPGALDGGSTPSGADFVVLAGPPGGEAVVPVTSVWVDGNQVLLALERPVAARDTVTLTYLMDAMHPIRDAQGLLAAPLADEPVRNQTGIPPEQAAVLDRVQSGARPGRLDLSSRNLTDLSALAGLSGVRELDLSDNAITDLSPLSDLSELEVLDLSGNRIEELWPLAGLPGLVRLNLSDNRIDDIATLSSLTGLEVLDLSGNRIEELWPLAGLTELQRLNLSGNRITDIDMLSGLSGLDVLLLDRNRVADVEVLSPLTELANLGLSENRIEDIGLLANLGRLRRLDLSGNAVADVTALGDVSELLWLRLPGNPVSDVAPLGRLEMLRWLWLDPGAAAKMEALALSGGRGAARLWIERVPAQ